MFIGKSRNGMIRYIFLGLVGSLLILLAGWWVMNFRSSQVDSRIRSEMLAQVIDLARTINQDDVKGLSYSEADIKSPHYQRIRGQMMAYGRLINQRGIYSMALKNGRIVFGPENYEEGDPMGSGPPGTVFENPTPDDFSIFKTGIPMVMGPSKDEYGIFISASAPVFDPVTGKVLMAVGIDILAGDWENAMFNSMILPGVYTVLLLLLLAIGLCLIYRRNKLPREQRFRLRHVETIFIAVTCALLSGYMTILIYESALREQDYLFKQQAAAQVEQIREFHGKIQQDIQSLRKFFESDEEVDSLKFSKFIGSMGINPRVFTITWAQRDQDGHLQVRFTSNISDKILPISTDLISNGNFKQLIDQVVKSSMIFGSESLCIRGDSPQNTAVFVFNPVTLTKLAGIDNHHDSIVGIIVAAIRMNAMVDSPTPLPGLNHLEIVTDLLDLNTSGNPGLVATYPPGHFNEENTKFTLLNIKNLKPSKITPLFMFGRAYALLSHPNDAFYNKYSDLTTWIAGLIGLLVTISFTLFVRFIRNQQYLLERVVNQRTAELNDRVEELIVAKNQAEASDKLKTAFLNNISHEVRTPLNGILGFSGLLAQPDVSETDRDEFYSLLKESSNRLMSTITSYMDMSLLVTGNMTVTRKYFLPAQILETIVEQHQQRCILKNLKLSLDLSFEDHELYIFSDSELFGKILRALLDNAIKFTSHGEIILGYKQLDGWIEFFVKDTGSGIGIESQKRIFETFMQEELSHTRGYEGSGLGLSIAMESLRLLGGNIRVESVKNSGSIFFFTLPFDPDSDRTTYIKESATKTTGKSDGLILVVEDDDTNRLYIETILNKAAFKTILAENGEEAVAICRSIPAVSLVLMDLKMPVMDGFEATRLIKSLRNDLPVIAITAYAMTGDDRKAIESGCDDYLTKPINKDLLLVIISKYLISLP